MRQIQLHSDVVRLAPVPQRKTRPGRQANILPVIIAALILFAWWASTRDSAAAFLVASPLAVINKFIELIGNGQLFANILATLTEIALGFGLGVTCAFVLGYGIARNRIIERSISPYAVASQAVPIIAIAPVLIRLFGPGLVSNGIICALVVFFPMLVSTMVGMRGIDPNLRDLMRVLRATRWQTFTRLEIPAALPALMGGFKISTTLAVVGAIVGEAVSSQAGLGFMIYQERYVYDSAGIMVGVLTLTALSLTLYEIMARLERRLLRWRKAG